MMISQKRALNMLRTFVVSSSQKTVAAKINVSPQYLCDVLNERRDPAGILARIGFERVVMYRKVRNKP